MININKKILLLYFVVATISSKILYNYNLFFSLITIDGLMGACSWMISYFNKNTKYTNVVENAQIYDNSVLDRIISYLVFYFGYVGAKTFLWTKDIAILYYLITLIPIPEIINNFIKSDIYGKINNVKQILVKKIIAKNIALGVKTAAKIYINKDVVIKYKEIMPLLSDYEKSIDITKNITKNLLLVLLMSCIKKYTSKFYYDIGKMIVSYKFGDKIESFNVNGARSKLVNIIDNKQWNKILKPEFIKLILNIYEEHENNSDTIKKMITHFSITFSGMLTVWTICSFCKYSCIAPIISVIMLLYRREHGIKLYNNLAVLFAVLCGSIIWNNQYLVMSLLAQFGHLIIFNKFTLLICKNIFKNIYKWINKIITRNIAYNKMLIYTIPYIVTIRYMLSDTLLYKILALNMIYTLLVNRDKKYNVINIIVATTTMLANSSFHIIYNGILTYVMVSFIDRNIFVDLCNLGKKIILLGKHNNSITDNNILKIKQNNKVMTQLPTTLSDTKNNINLDLFELPHEQFMEAITVKSIDDSKVGNTVYIIEDYGDESPIVQNKIN